ncbi:hypothetical protein [Kitasatospora sp. NPDC101183]|uniref:hypothetical protein n=1 Tax=Kitasatospora sp. NPDC101183 TaxID=3364100 RepID=UPI003807BD48
MSIAPRSVRAVGLLLAAGLVSAVGVAAASASASPAAPASGSSVKVPAPMATPWNNVTLCSKGTYASYLVFEKHPTMSIAVVQPNGCRSFSVTGQRNDRVGIYGIGPDGKPFKIATDTFDDTVPYYVETTGTPDQNDWKSM